MGPRTELWSSERYVFPVDVAELCGRRVKIDARRWGPIPPRNDLDGAPCPAQDFQSARFVQGTTLRPA